jgi:hypothetical protein
VETPGPGVAPDPSPRLVWPCAALVAVTAFAFRFLSQGNFTNDHFMHLAWAQQMLFGEVPGRDFIEPGMPLTVALSAGAQWIHFGPVSELVLTIGLLSSAAAVVFVATARLCGSLTAGLLASLFVLAMHPRLYNYPKILVPAVAMLAVHAYACRPAPRLAAILGAWAACATLLRHDLGVYTTTALLVSVLIGGQRARARHAAAFGGALVLTLSPYLVLVATTEGLLEHVRVGLEFSRGEQHQILLSWPLPQFVSCVYTGAECSWTRGDSVAYLFWLARLLAVVTAVVLIVQWRSIRPTTRAAMAAAGVLMAGYAIVIVRHPIEVRVADASVPLAITGTWLAMQPRRSTGPRRVGLFTCVALVVTTTAASVYDAREVRDRVLDTRVFEGITTVARVGRGVLRRAADPRWPGFWPIGDVPDAVRYVASCTGPDDRLLLTWSAPEYYYFSRRGFAGGHAMMLSPRAYGGARDQTIMLERLQRQRVPVVLINETRRSDFRQGYPEVDRFLTDAYEPAGRFTIRDGSVIVVAVRRGLAARSTYDGFGWPCEFDTSAAS